MKIVPVLRNVILLPFSNTASAAFFLFQSSGSPAMTVCRMRRIPHPRRLRKRAADKNPGGSAFEPPEHFYTVFVQAFWISSSAICTQLVAAPLRT